MGTTELVEQSGESPSHVQLDGAGRLAAAFTLAALAVILFGTLYPFNFSAQLTETRRMGFFLFWFTPVAKGWVGWTLNVLFFMPFGSTLAWWTWTRRWSPRARGTAAFLAGCLLSYSVEFLQLYVPGRDSSWDDVVMNTLGSVVGWLVFEWLGLPVLRLVGEALGEFTAMLER